MYLTRQQRFGVLHTALTTSAGKIPIIAGIGAMSTAEALMLAKDARKLGATAGLLSMPCYIPLHEEEVFSHFESIATQSQLPLIIYDNPGVTHFEFSPRLIQRLATLKGVVAIKNRFDYDLSSQHLELPADFLQGCSGDRFAIDALQQGAMTWYSVLGGLLPMPCQRLIAAIRQGQLATAQQLHHQLTPIWELFSRYSSIRVMYALAERLAQRPLYPPRPVQPLPAEAKADVAAVAAALPTEWWQ